MKCQSLFPQEKKIYGQFVVCLICQESGTGYYIYIYFKISVRNRNHHVLGKCFFLDAC